MDDVHIQFDIVSLDRPPQEYFAYNYDYGRLKLRNAIQCLIIDPSNRQRLKRLRS